MRKLRQVIVVSDLLDVKQSSEIIRAIRIGSSQSGKKNLSKNLFQAVSLSQTESRKWRDFYGARQKQMLFLRIKSPFFCFHNFNSKRTFERFDCPSDSIHNLQRRPMPRKYIFLPKRNSCGLRAEIM